MNMYNLLIEEEKYLNAFNILIECFYYSLSGIDELSASPYISKLEYINLEPYYINSLIYLTPILNMTDDEISLNIKNIISRINLPFHYFSDDEFVNIVISQIHFDNGYFNELISNKECKCSFNDDTYEVKIPININSKKTTKTNNIINSIIKIFKK